MKKEMGRLQNIYASEVVNYCILLKSEKGCTVKGQACGKAIANKPQSFTPLALVHQLS